MIKVGEHITLDIIGTDKEYDPSVYERVINEIAKAANVTILNISKSILKKFEKDKPIPKCINTESIKGLV